MGCDSCSKQAVAVLGSDMLAAGVGFGDRGVGNIDCVWELLLRRAAYGGAAYCVVRGSDVCTVRGILLG